MAYNIPSWNDFMNITLKNWYSKGLIQKTVYDDLYSLAQQCAKIESSGGANNTTDQTTYTRMQAIRKLNLGYNRPYTLNYDSSKAILDKEVFAKDSLKQSVLDYVSLASTGKPLTFNPILLWGAPGTGKTNFIDTLAKSLDRDSNIVTMAGVGDRNYLVGSAPMWVGSTYGKIIECIINSGCMNPVIGLDELEKTIKSNGNSGEMDSALFSILDFEQNKAFTDLFIGFPIDISQVAFIATANTIDSVHPALQDRFNKIYVPGYTPAEKEQLWEVYMTHKIAKAVGLKDTDIITPDPIRKIIIKNYTQEQGSRQLERVYQSIVLYVMRKGVTYPYTITEEDVFKALGNPVVLGQTAIPKDTVGSISTIAYPEGNSESILSNLTVSYTVGADYFTNIDSQTARSWNIAKDYITNINYNYGVDLAALKSWGLHIHLPQMDKVNTSTESASAVALAILSYYTDKPIPAFTGAIGEIDLKGNLYYKKNLQNDLQVLLLSGCKIVYAPKPNEEESKTYTQLEGLNIKFISNLEEAIKDMHL